MTITFPHDRVCRIYHVRQDLGKEQRWYRAGKNHTEGIASLLANIPGVTGIITGAYEIVVRRGEAFTDEEVFGPVEALIRDMEGETK